MHIKNVLSLFDGMSCGQIALNRAGITYDNYFASEIDSPAIKVAKANYPNTKHIGDVTKIRVAGEYLIADGKAHRIGDIGILIGGSPCQGFSFAGKQLNFDDPRSALFFEFVRLLKEIRAVNPDVKFLLENVKMKKQYQDVISEYLGVEPITINGDAFTPANRPRLFWTNIEVQAPAHGRNTVLRDILQPESEVADNFRLSEKAVDYMSRLRNGKPRWEFHANPLDGIAACLTACMCKGVPYGVIKELGRRLTPIECERLQSVPDNYTSSVPTTHRYQMLGNGWNVAVIAHIFRHMAPAIA